MAESVASFLLGKIGQFLEEEKNLLTGVRGEVEYIKSELEHMRAFLRIAESMEETDPQVGVWIKQVREIAFDIDDVIDELSFRFANSRRDVEPCGFIGKIIRSVKNVKYRHQLGYEIQSIKSRIENVSKGRERYKLNVPEQRCSSSSTTAIAATNMWDDHRGNALLQEEADLVGIKNSKRQLIQFLSEGGSALKVISVVGMGGLGKTTLVKKVYDDVKNDFKNHAWITVSQSFNTNELLKGIIRTLLKQSQKPIPDEMEKMPRADLMNEVKELLRGSKYLLVFDDVWRAHHWESIMFALPPNNFGSRIMLTTRNIEVADATSGEVYALKPLSHEASMNLFSKRIFKKHECPLEWLNITEDILERCEGLPLAIVAISGLLATSGMSSKENWEMVKRSLQSEIGGDKLQTMTKILLLSYHDLPFYLKACMLYVCVFPEDYQINCMQLIRLWIAEGFVEQKEGKTLEEVAAGYLYELLNRSLLQVAWVDITGRIRACRVHDIMREVILSKAKDQNFVAIVSSDQQGSRLWHETAVRRLSVHNASLGSNIAHGNKSHLSKLRSFLLFGAEDIKLKRLFSVDLRLLTVLDLRGASLKRFPREILKLYHLRYLSLRDTIVDVLPTSIEKLQNLETLDLKRTCVMKLPKTIVNLQRLRYLLAYYQYRGDKSDRGSVKSISGIGHLQSLQKLCFLRVGGHNAQKMLQEIEKLSQLRRLGMEMGILRSEYGKPFCFTVDSLTNLRSLWVSTMGDSIIELQCISSPPRYLQRMYLLGCLERVPKWVSSLDHLSKLELVRSHLKEDVLEPIQALPNLVRLVLDGAFDGEKLCFKNGGFQKLQNLKVLRLKGLTTMEVVKGAISNLEDLCIWQCDKLQRVPFGIEHLAKLKLLQLSPFVRDLIDTIDGENAIDYWRVQHIPCVRIGWR